MIYLVDAAFAVEYLDPDDMVGRGIRTIRRRCAGPLEAATAEEAAAIVRRYIAQHHPGCWKLIVGDVHVALAEQEIAS